MAIIAESWPSYKTSVTKWTLIFYVKKFFALRLQKQRHLVLLFDPNYRPSSSIPKQTLITVWQPSIAAEFLTEIRSLFKSDITRTILFRYKANREVVNFCCNCKCYGHFLDSTFNAMNTFAIVKPLFFYRLNKGMSVDFLHTKWLVYMCYIHLEWKSVISIGVIFLFTSTPC